MPVIFEVTGSQFRKAMQGNPFFCWFETKDRFVLLKPMDSCLLKTVYFKRGDEQQDALWRDTNIVNQTASVHVINIEGFDTGEKVDKIIGLLEDLNGRISESRWKTVQSKQR